MPNTFTLPPSPLLGTDVSAFVLLVLAALYAALWWRDREPGMAWLGASFGVFGFWWATTRAHMPTSANVPVQQFTILLSLAVLLLQTGLVRYLGLSDRARRFALQALYPFPLAAAALVVASIFVPIRRDLHTLAITFGLVGCAVLALWAARREPRAGHGFVGVALLSIPIVTIIAVLFGADVVLVRYLAPLPIILFGLVLLTVSLLRRRYALEAEIRRRRRAEAALEGVNASLEAQVQQRTADLQEMVTGLQSFNRSVSHDLRGPLGGIAQLSGLAEQAVQRGETELATRMLSAIRMQSESSERLVAALLTLARVGDAPLRCELVDLETLAREVAESLQAATCAATPTPVAVAPLPQAEADPALLRAVFTNLIGNALKFTGPRADGHVSLTGEADAEAITIHIADNGAGFDAAAAADLFKPFQRLHGAAFEGHGVGLSIVRRAVERHGGRIWAQGRPGAGATFSFSLPRAARSP